MVIINPNQWAEFMLRHDPYAMKVDSRRNCYNCEKFGHLAKNQRIVGRGRRLEYGDNLNNTNSNLNGKKSLVVLN